MENKWIKYEADGAAVVTLSKQAEMAGMKVGFLRMREPLVEDQLAVDDIQKDATKELTLYANLCMVTPGDLQKLPMRDYKRLQAAFMGFLD